MDTHLAGASPPAHAADAAALVATGAELARRGQLHPAEQSLRAALALAPGHVEARRRLALVMVEAGHRDEAARLLHDELATPAGVAWLDEQIAALMHGTDLAPAGRLAELSARLRWGSDRWPASAALPPPATVPNPLVSAAKLHHDADQLRYLIDRGVLEADWRAIADDHDAIAARLRAAGVTGQAPLDAAGFARIGHVYNRQLYVRPTPRLPQALASTWSPAAVERQYLDRPPGVVVIDDFLHPDALAALRAFCLESTVWSANRYAHGRLGAFFRDGFGCPLLLQIAEELRAALPAVIGARYPLRQLWGFKYDHTLPADATTHADFAAVNVNFWLTPETANLDDGSGGLIVYEADAPPEWDFHTYNGDPALIHDYLRRQRARRVRIPYRANRAIIFNSDLFHATDAVRFRPGYVDRRVNITMLYGQREGDVHHAPRPAAAGTGEVASWRSAAFRRSR
ncbi:MAG: hypothetical protein JNK64_19030 [Myxococcales bacterium]|nr:hypothetical protein [Myxococcales bacterium]